MDSGVMRRLRRSKGFFCFRETPRSRLFFQVRAQHLRLLEQKLIDIFPELLANNAVCRD